MSPGFETQRKAAADFIQVVIGALQDERGVRAEDAVAGAARMAGTFLFRSFGFPLVDVKPGSAVLSEQANADGPQLIQLLAGLLQDNGVVVDHSRAAEPVPPENAVGRPFLETQKLLEPGFNAAAAAHGLQGLDAAVAAVLATAILIRQCASTLDPTVAFAIAVYGFVEGSKTCPDPVKL